MEGITVEGTTIEVQETQTVGQNNFKKRLLVVKTDSQHPQELPIEFVQEKVGLLDNVKVGQKVKVHINLRGSKSGERWYPSIQGWKIE